MTLYEINKNAYSDLPEVDKDKAIDTIRNYILHDSNTYYMMVNHDTRYFTLFVWEHDPTAKYFAAEIFKTAQSIGEVKAVESNENMLEIWIQQDKECNMYGFFKYDRGVITV